MVKDDGSQEKREVTVGVADRVNAAILSGLSEGERVLSGTETEGPRAGRAGRGAPGRGPLLGPGGFR